jgi:hypothetical protein
MENVETKTEPWELESNMSILCDHDGWCLTVGGGQMPKYNVVGDTLLEAITRLVHAVTEDAIKDEAREWQNVKVSDRPS